MRVETVKFKRAYVQIAEQILQLIERGELKPGDRLPPEREMAALFQTSRATVREAVSALELAGVVEVLVGRGSFIRGEASAFAPGLLSALETRVAPSDLIELRFALEPAAAAHAAERATPENIEELRYWAEECSRAATANQDQFETLDGSFHLAVATASHNPLFVRLTQEMTDLRTNPMWKLMKSRSNLIDPEQLRHYAQEHWDIVKAIERRDPQAAADMSAHHLERVRINVLGEGTKADQTDNAPAADD